MKSTTFAIASLLATGAIAQPRRHHQHQAKHAKRDVAPVVIVTEWETVMETVGYTTTIWVEAGFVAPTSAATTTSSPAPLAPSVAPSSATPVAAQFHESAAAAVEQSPSSSSPVYVAPAPSSNYEAPAPSASAESSSEAQSSTSVSSVYVPPTASAPATTAPAASYAAPAPSPTTASSSGGSSSSNSGCSEGSPCDGDFTYYEAGLGACGETNNGATDKIVALSSELMGSLSSGDQKNSNCGKTITVEYEGKTTTATVVDKCPGCSLHSIDLSNAAFLELASLDLGRGQAKWWFN